MKSLIQTSLVVLLVLGDALMAQQPCQPTKHNPIGSTNQGGYNFDYYSGAARECRLFKLRNHPGKLETPVIWKSPAEVFIDTILAKCPSSAKTCDWIEITKTTWNQAYNAQTDLSYGLNKDSYHERPLAFCEPQLQNGQSGGLSPMITSISGVISDRQNKPITVHFDVSSTAEKNADGIQFQYAVRAGEGNVPMKVSASQSRKESGYVVTWEAAESPAFLEQFSHLETKDLRPGSAILVKTVKHGIKLVLKPLAIWQDGKPIFSTTAAAYSPKE
jgi:hypothetical protein